MANVLVEESSLQGIANAIRNKNGSSDTYTPAQMSGAIDDISGGGQSGLPSYQLLGQQVQLTEYKTYSYCNDSDSGIGNTLTYHTSPNNWRIAKGNIQKDYKYFVCSRLPDSGIVDCIITDNNNKVLWKYRRNSNNDGQIQTIIDTTGLDDTNGLVIHVSYGKQDVDYILNQAGYIDFFLQETKRLSYPVAVRKINSQNNSGILYDIMSILNGTCTQLNDTEGKIKYLTKDLFYRLKVDNSIFNYRISLNFPAVEFIDKRCFSTSSDYKNYSPFTSANLPNCIGINSWAFQYCPNLTSVYAPNLEETGQSAFNTTGLTGSVTFEKLKNVGAWTFQYCTNMTAISLPVAEYIGEGAFANCTSLSSVSLPNVTYAFGNTFGGCTSLIEITLPLLRNTTNTGYLFRDCTNLKKAYLPSVTNYYSNWFSGCSHLEEVLMGNQLFDTVGSFPAAKGTLKKAVFPNLSQMKAKVLENFTVLETLIIGTNLETVCSLTVANAFAGTPIASGTGYIYVPDSLVSSYQTATNWSTYAAQIKGLSELPQD